VDISCLENNNDIEAIENYRVMVDISEEIFHDFKNILATISGLAQLSMIKAQSEELKSYLTRINQATFDFRDILNKYYSYTNGMKEQKEEPCVVYTIINSALEMIRFRLRTNSTNCIELKTNIQSSSKVICTEYKLKQSFLNIMMNAIDSMEKSGGELFIDICDNKDKNFVIIDIIDTGVGISEENLERIFKSKFTTKERGSGLGLKIAKNCVEGLGGSIQITSEVNKGTKLQILLPIYNDEMIIN
jgi:two-component system sporulation sensor kinase A